MVKLGTAGQHSGMLLHRSTGTLNLPDTPQSLLWCIVLECISVAKGFSIVFLAAHSDLDVILMPLCLLSVFPQLYFHMIRQRKKVLGPAEDYSKVE